MCISCNNLTHAHTLYMGAGVGTSNKNRPQTQANDAGSERSLENFCCFFVFTFCAEDFLLAHPGRRFGQQRHAQSKLSSVAVHWLWFGAPIACGEVQLSLHSLLHCHLHQKCVFSNRTCVESCANCCCESFSGSTSRCVVFRGKKTFGVKKTSVSRIVGQNFGSLCQFQDN